jgi:imidazolonepropionase-like amidohydrolase
MEGQIGTLEVGKLADILIVDGDPLADIHALTKVHLVLREGKSI